VPDELKRFGASIKALRLARGWSQERLAYECELDRSYVGGVERGERNVSLVNIYKIAKALKVAPARMFEGGEK